MSEVDAYLIRWLPDADVTCTIPNPMIFSGACTFSGTLTYSGAVTFNGNVTFNDDIDLGSTVAVVLEETVEYEKGFKVSGPDDSNARGLDISGACTTPISITGAFTTGINVAADGTTAIAVTNAFSGTDGIVLGGTHSDCGIEIDGTCADGIRIDGACSDNGIEIVGACTDSAIKVVTGGFATGLALDADGTTGIDITSNFSGTTMLNLAGTAADGIIISGACSDNGIEISGVCSGAAIEITGGAFQQAVTGEGWSYNLISVTSTCTAGEGTRGWRVNMTTSDSIATGDMQCVHGYMTLGSSATIAASAAINPLSAWLDVPDSTTTSTGNVICGCRVIFDPNNNDYSALSGGGESALFYGQTWASTGKIEHGLRVIAGTGTTIKNALSVGGAGTYNKIIDLTDWEKDTTLILMQGGPKDSTETAHLTIAAGDASDHAGIVAALGGTSYGSLYLSTAGKLWVNEAGTWTSQT